MKRLLALLLSLCALSLSGGTKEDLERLQSELKALESRLTGLSLEMQDVRKRLEVLESRLDAVSRSSQTADLRVDLDELKRKVEALSSEVGDIRSNTVTESAPQPPVSGGEPVKESPQDVYQGAYAEYIQGRYENAIAEYKRFMTLFPDHPLAENCLYWTGESYYGLKRYDEAKKSLLLAMERYPRGAKFLSAKLKYALACYNLGEKTECRKILGEIVSAAPASPESDVAREKLKTLFAN